MRTQRAREALKARLVQRARDFDPAALIDLLASLGYDGDHIHFESHESQASQRGLVHEVRFYDTPERLPFVDDRAASRFEGDAGRIPAPPGGMRWRAAITPLAVVRMNMGLLAPQSPLPSYFFQFMDDPMVRRDAFCAFLRYFDDRLLRAHLLSQHPELSARLIKDYAAHRKSLLHSVGMSSVATLHTLFTAAFPELDVSVERSDVERITRSGVLTLGESALGGGQAFGGRRKISSAGFVVRLRAADPTTPQGAPWGVEARRRFDTQVGPILKEERIDAKVVIETAGAPESLALGPHAHIGFGVLGARRASPDDLNIHPVGES